MSGVEVGLVIVSCLLTVLLAALLRAQAVTSRRLATVERVLLRRQRRTEEPSAVSGEEPRTGPPTSAQAAGDLVDVRGVAIDGAPTVYPLGSSTDPTLVAFLSTTCGTCLGLWRRLGEEGLGSVASVVVTKDPAVEDVDVARELAARSTVPVVMSSEAWDEYEVPGSPYFLVVGGDAGTVLAEGEASSWEGVRRLAEIAT